MTSISASMVGNFPASTMPSPAGGVEKKPNFFSSTDGDNLEQNLTGASEAEPSRRNFGTFRWILAMAAAYTTCFVYGLDNTVVANIQGAVVTRFDTVEKLSWLGSGFPLGGIATILAQGKFYGSFEFKYLYLGNIAIFGIGSAVCGAAPNMNALIVGRIIAGIGAAGMYLGTLSLISMFTTLKERSIYMGIVVLAWGSGTILGPIIGGAFADSSATWRWAFYVNLIIFGALTPIYVFCIPNTHPQPGMRIITKLFALDWVGMILNSGIYAVWVIALQFGGSTWPWRDGRTISCFIVAGLLVILLGIQQHYCIFTDLESRLFPIIFLKRRTMMLLYMVTSCINAALFIVVYYIPVYFQFVHGDSGIHSAVRLLPFIVTLVVFTLFNGFTMPQLPHYSAWYFISGAVITAGAAMLYTVDSSTSSSFIYGATVLLGIGTGTCNAAYTVAASKAKAAEVNDALSFMNIAQIGGIMHALAISGTLYQNIAASALNTVFGTVGLNFSHSDIGSVVGGTKSVVYASLSPEVKGLAINAIVIAIQKVWILLVATGAFTIVCSMLMRWEKLILKVQAGM